MPEVDPEIRCEKHDRIMSLVANVPVKVFEDDEPRWMIYQSERRPEFFVRRTAAQGERTLSLPSLNWRVSFQMYI